MIEFDHGHNQIDVSFSLPQLAIYSKYRTYLFFLLLRSHQGIRDDRRREQIESIELIVVVIDAWQEGRRDSTCSIHSSNSDQMSPIELYTRGI